MKSQAAGAALTSVRLLTFDAVAPSASHAVHACPMKSPVSPFEVARHVRAALEGSQDAYSWLYRRFAPLVHTIHLGVTTHPTAEDLTQETFDVAFARLSQLREVHQFGPWIAAIARRQRPRMSPLQVPMEEHHDAATAEAGPDDAAEAARVLNAVRTLPETYRETLLLRLVEGMSGPEIAALTGLTPGSVRVNLHRGMAMLRAALGLGGADDEVFDVRA
jgi:RNA polymerase sigma-70 factor (ECF subfamily)